MEVVRSVCIACMYCVRLLDMLMLGDTVCSKNILRLVYFYAFGLRRFILYEIMFYIYKEIVNIEWISSYHFTESSNPEICLPSRTTISSFFTFTSAGECEFARIFV